MQAKALISCIAAIIAVVGIGAAAYNYSKANDTIDTKNQQVKQQVETLDKQSKLVDSSNGVYVEYDEATVAAAKIVSGYCSFTRRGARSAVRSMKVSQMLRCHPELHYSKSTMAAIKAFVKYTV